MVMSGSAHKNALINAFEFICISCRSPSDHENHHQVDSNTEMEDNTELDTLTTGTPVSPPPGPCLNGLIGPAKYSRLVTLNISGLKFQVSIDTLNRFPDTLLGSAARRAPYYMQETDEYFFERHRPSFDAILHYYHSGGLIRRPSGVQSDVFDRELKFFEIHPARPEPVRQCSIKMDSSQYGHDGRWFGRVWMFVEVPDSSRYSRVFAIVSFIVILISTISFCLETIPELHDPFECPNNSSGRLIKLVGNATAAQPCSTWNDPFFVVESICIFWFTIEFLLRAVSCPSKMSFAKGFLNWMDLMAILPFYVNLVLTHGESAASFAILRVLRLVRVFRIFKLSRHSRGLQLLGRTLSASVQELGLLSFFLLMALVLSGSAIYFAESGVKGTQFTSIPASFWYVCLFFFYILIRTKTFFYRRYGIVTLTTVGYGDLTPQTALGKLVGGICAITGVLVLALPVTVIVSNFKRFYEKELRERHEVILNNHG